MPKTIEELHEQYVRLGALWADTPPSHPAYRLTKKKCREAFIAWRDALKAKYPEWNGHDYPAWIDVNKW